MSHSNFPLPDCGSIRINSSALKSSMMLHSYLHRLFSWVFPARERRNHRKHLRICGVRGNMARFTFWFTHCQRSAPGILISFSHKSGLLICRCLTLPQHMDLVTVWQFELAAGLSLLGPWPEWKKFERRSLIWSKERKKERHRGINKSQKIKT